MKKFLSICFFLLSLIRVNGQAFGFIAANTGKDSITVQFDTLSANEETAAYVKHMRGYMNQSPAVTCTGGNNNTIVVTAVPGNWAPSGGNTQFPNDGITNGTAFSWLTKIQRECAFQASSNVYVFGSYQFYISGLKPTSTYLIQITASVSPSVLNAICGSDYRISGASLYGPVTLYAENPAGTANVSGIAPFSSVQPNSSGDLYFYLNAATSSGTAVIATISGFRLVEN